MAVRRSNGPWIARPLTPTIPTRSVRSSRLKDDYLIVVSNKDIYYEVEYETYRDDMRRNMTIERHISEAKKTGDVKSLMNMISVGMKASAGARAFCYALDYVDNKLPDIEDVDIAIWEHIEGDEYQCIFVGNRNTTEFAIGNGVREFIR